MIHYHKPQTDAAGNRLTYEQRRAIRRAQEAEKRASQTPETPTREPVYDMTFDERQGLRKAEELGRREAASIAEQQQASRKAAELAAIPEHLRRPANVWRDLIRVHQSQSYRPEIVRKIADYEKRAILEDSRLDALMAEKARRHAVESNPETVKAREHHLSASAGAETHEEKQEWARLSGLIEAGAANDYWNQAAPLMSARLAKLQERVSAEQAASLNQEAAEQAASEALADAMQIVKDAQ